MFKVGGLRSQRGDRGRREEDAGSKTFFGEGWAKEEKCLFLVSLTAGAAKDHGWCMGGRKFSGDSLIVKKKLGRPN